MVPVMRNTSKEKPAVKQKLLLSDIMCPICWNILIEPVTLPCKHELCMPCFEQNVQVANFECPMCRSRISNWARRASKGNSLINQNRWKEIQEAFPEKVKNRLEGVEDDISPEEFPPCCEPVTEPGEVRKEYERQLKKYQEEEARERELEALASAELIRKLSTEEQQVVELQRIEQEQILRDEILAQELFFNLLEEQQLEDRRLSAQKPKIEIVTNTPLEPEVEIVNNTPQEQEVEIVTSTPLEPKVEGLTTVDSMLKDLNTDLCDFLSRSDTAMELPRCSDGSASASSSRLHSSQPFRSRNATPGTYAHGKGSSASASLRSTSAESNDSITSEMYHFKPITAAPKTPPKRQPDGRLEEPAVVQTKARKLDYSPEDTFSEVLNKKINSIIDETNLGACGGSESATVGNSSVQSTLATHSSIYVMGASKLRNTFRKPQGIDSSFKENYPLYPGPHGSKAAVSTRMPRALAKRSQNRMDASDSLCSVAEETETSSVLEESDYQRQEQENADWEFAQKLQKELDKTIEQVRRVNRCKGSENEYNLRSGARKRSERP